MATDFSQNHPAPLQKPHGLPTNQRLFAWSMLAVLVGFLINNLLTTAYNLPGIAPLLHGDFSPLPLMSATIYLAAITIAVSYVLHTSDHGLRDDALRIHHANQYLVRAAFFTVLLIGITDASIAFLRIEGGFDAILSEASVKLLNKPRWLILNIHLPLIFAGLIIAYFSKTLGFTWLALLIIIAELSIVISRFVFSYEQAFMSDLVRYWYAALFLFASAYTLFDDGHVRVDVLYAGFGRSKRGKANAFGAIFLGMSTVWTILAIGLASKQSIINSPIISFEISQAGSVGMFVKYQMAAFLAVFASSMLIQFTSFFLEACADIRNDPGARDAQSASH